MNVRTVLSQRGFVPTLAMLLPVTGVIAACSNDAPITPTAVAASVPASFGKNVSGTNQRILFTSNRDGNDEVYSVNPDGTGAARLTNADGSDQFAVWSPDGKQIAFVSIRDNPLGEIYLMNADGTGVVRLTNSAGKSDAPSWSKDGKQIVFSSTRDAANPATLNVEDVELYIMNVDGTGVRRLTNNTAADGSPAWSPDGRQIAFFSRRDHPLSPLLLKQTDLYVMDVDGTHVTRLTIQEGLVDYPSYDPHGRRLAFSIANSPESGIYTLDLNTLGLTRLTFGGSAIDAFPSWSVDGSQLVFTSQRDGRPQLYVMNADGTEQTRLMTTDQANDKFARWSR
jgi:Tol biopolymer transport system component